MPNSTNICHSELLHVAFAPLIGQETNVTVIARNGSGSGRHLIAALAGLSGSADQQASDACPEPFDKLRTGLSKGSNLLRTLRVIAGGGLLRSPGHARY
jgi:hypothetical protein